MSIKKLTLTTSERIILGTICPEKDNIDRLLIRKSIMEKAEIKSEEAKEIELKQVANALTWNDKAKDLEVEFSEVEINYLRNCVNELSNKAELHASMVNLYQKIKA